MKIDARQPVNHVRQSFYYGMSLRDKSYRHILSPIGTTHIAPKEKKPQLFKEAIAALNHALEIRTIQHFPVDWAQSQNNLADTYFAMEDWAKAAECYENVLKVNPNDKKALERLKLIREKR